MAKTCVVVADRARARFFLTEDTPGHHPEHAFKLVEIEALANPQGELTGMDLFANTRSGTTHAPDGARYEYDDHREAHSEEVERRFAKQLSAAIVRTVRTVSPVRIILAVEPHMLGLLRRELPSAVPSVLTFLEMPVELSWRTPEHIRRVLEKRGAFAQRSAP